MALPSSLSLLLVCISIAIYGPRTNLFLAKGIELENLKSTILPGQPRVAFQQLSGYVMVNQSKQLFYYFTEAVLKPQEKPLILWLNGGPGCSSVAFGAFIELGPFRVEWNGALSINKYSWNHVANVLFLDAPIGTGFSYSNTSSDYDEIGVMSTARDIYTFISMFVNIHPCDGTLFLAGQHYASQFILQLADLIIEGNKNLMIARRINLTGICLGNPTLDFESDSIGELKFSLNHGIITKQLYNSILTNCDFKTANFTKECEDALKNYAKLDDIIDPLSLYTPPCHNATKQQAPTCSEYGYDSCRPTYASVYFNRLDVQNAIHATRNRSKINWHICNYNLTNVWNDDPLSMVPLLEKILGKGVNVTIYSGDTSIRNSVVGTSEVLEKLSIPPTSELSPWYFNDTKVGGFKVQYGNLNFLSILECGEDGPAIRPLQVLYIITKFLEGKEF